MGSGSSPLRTTKIMLIREITKNVEARDALKRGVDQLADAVKVTLGPKGRNVVIQSPYGGHSPIITKDGVTVAKSIELEDPIENMGAQMIRDVAAKTVQLAGDGTTTATILAQKAIELGLAAISEGANPLALKRGMDKAVAAIVRELKKKAIPVTLDGDRIRQVAMVSTNGDEKIANMIAEAMKLVGEHGIVKVEDSKMFETKMEHVKGMHIQSGMVHHFFQNQPGRAVCKLDNPLILVMDKELTVLQALVPILEQVFQTQQPLLVIANEMAGDALALLSHNNQNMKLKCCVVHSPFVPDRFEVLSDIAVYTGGELVSENTGIGLESLKIGQLGRATQVIVDMDTCTIVGGGGNKANISERIMRLSSTIKEGEKDTPAYDATKTRISNMSGGVAMISVGGKSELEAQELRDRIDDAVHATRAAVEEGVLPGGGAAYIQTVSGLAEVILDNDDEMRGWDIVTTCVSEPLYVMLINSGYSHKPDRCIEPQNFWQKLFGIERVYYAPGEVDRIHSFIQAQPLVFNLRINEYEKWGSTEVVDPVKVLRVALESAMSIAGIMLTTEVVVSNKPAMSFIPAKGAQA